SELKGVERSREKLEMELLYSRATVNGDLGSDGEELPEDSIYKARYERARRELEWMRGRLEQKHQEEVEGLVGLKKQVEKKLQDAYEEVEEQRGVVSQWKRKAARFQAELADLRHLLEEQTARNNLLEKKHRKFDGELALAVEEGKAERREKERIQREKDLLTAEKFAFEQQLNGLKLDLELKEEKLETMKKELDELTSSGRGDEEITSLRRTKHEMERKLKDQEEELDELSGQVGLLEQAKLRLEMSIESMRKEQRKELQLKDEEIEEYRAASQKKIKAMESQLEEEHEERTLLVREKHDLERKLMDAQDNARQAGNSDKVTQLKRELKRTRALLKDAQTMLERAQNDVGNKALLRQLKNQLEDAEFGRMAALKSKQGLELELSEVQIQMEDVTRVRNDLDSKLSVVQREKSSLQTHLEDVEEEMQEVMRKYKATVSQVSMDQMTISEQASQLASAEQEKGLLKEQLAELLAKVEVLQGDTMGQQTTKKLEVRIKELESRLELEGATRARLEAQIARLKDSIESLSAEASALQSKEQLSQEATRRANRQLRDLKEDFTGLQVRETEARSKIEELTGEIERLEEECGRTRSDLKLALQRIEDLTAAMEGGGESLDSDSDAERDDPDSDSSDDNFETFLSNPGKSDEFSLSPGHIDLSRLTPTKESEA
ncbi:unnamed protein product, partial [Darwinula stevensoni]